MAWTQSGLYAAVLNLNLVGTTGPDWDINTNKFAVYNSTDAPAYDQAAASAIYATTNEVSGTGWAAGGIAASALGAGSTDISLAMSVTSSPATAKYGASNVSVASTTLASVVGGYFYYAAGATKYKIIGIWFGAGGPYSTTAGTFAITWSSSTIATIQCAAT